MPGSLFGRRAELAAVLSVLEGAGPHAVELVGEAGIGKTAIWNESVDQARLRGWRILAARPSAAEVQLSFGALGDLIGSLDDRDLADLAPPQRRALDVALLRADGPAVDAGAVAAGLLAALRRLAAERPVLVAIDDLQSLDGASAGALAFALRRIDPAPVAVLATRRGDHYAGAPRDSAAATARATTSCWAEP